MTRVPFTRRYRPQLFGDSAAARQARRAAGVLIDGDDPRFVEDNTRTRFTSVRKLVRSIARHRGKKSHQLSYVSSSYDYVRRKTLGLKTRVNTFKFALPREKTVNVNVAPIDVKTRGAWSKTKNFLGKLFGRGASRGRT